MGSVWREKSGEASLTDVCATLWLISIHILSYLGHILNLMKWEITKKWGKNANPRRQKSRRYKTLKTIWKAFFVDTNSRCLELHTRSPCESNMEAILHTRREAGNKTNVFCEYQYYYHFMPGYLSLRWGTLKIMVNVQNTTKIQRIERQNFSQWIIQIIDKQALNLPRRT